MTKLRLPRRVVLRGLGGVAGWVCGKGCEPLPGAIWSVN